MDPNSVESPLTSLAMLKVNYDSRQGDYLDYLIPFVEIRYSKRIFPVKVGGEQASEAERAD